MLINLDIDKSKFNSYNYTLQVNNAKISKKTGK